MASLAADGFHPRNPDQTSFLVSGFPKPFEGIDTRIAALLTPQPDFDFVIGDFIASMHAIRQEHESEDPTFFKGYLIGGVTGFVDDKRWAERGGLLTFLKAIPDVVESFELEHRGDILCAFRCAASYMLENLETSLTRSSADPIVYLQGVFIAAALLLGELARAQTREQQDIFSNLLLSTIGDASHIRDHLNQPVRDIMFPWLVEVSKRNPELGLGPHLTNLYRDWDSAPERASSTYFFVSIVRDRKRKQQVMPVAEVEIARERRKRILSEWMQHGIQKIAENDASWREPFAALETHIARNPVTAVNAVRWGYLFGNTVLVASEEQTTTRRKLIDSVITTIVTAGVSHWIFPIKSVFDSELRELAQFSVFLQKHEFVEHVNRYLDELSSGPPASTFFQFLGITSNVPPKTCLASLSRWIGWIPSLISATSRQLGKPAKLRIIDRHDTINEHILTEHPDRVCIFSGESRIEAEPPPNLCTVHLMTAEPTGFPFFDPIDSLDEAVALEARRQRLPDQTCVGVERLALLDALEACRPEVKIPDIQNNFGGTFTEGKKHITDFFMYLVQNKRGGGGNRKPKNPVRSPKYTRA